MPESFVRRNLTTILVAGVTAAVTGGGSAVAATIVDYARNADKVDNLHAVPASSTARAGKLVATGSDGRLPVGVIPPANAANSDRVDGLHAVGATSTAKAGKLVATDGSGVFPTSVIPKDATPWSRYVVVRSDAGSAAANATRLQQKVNALTASATSRWVVMVEPGAFDFGAGKLTLKPFVDVVGAGVDRTVITGTGGSSADAATVHVTKDSALRHVTVKTFATTATAAAYVGGIVNTDFTGDAEVSDVKVDVAYQSPQTKGSGTAYGIRNAGWSMKLRRVEISVSNGGASNTAVYNKGFLTAEQTTAYANGIATYNYGINVEGEADPYMTYSSVTLTDSRFAAYNGDVNWGLKSYNGYGTIVRSHLEGGIGLEAYSATDVYETFQIEGSTLSGSASTIVLYPRNSANVWRGSQLAGGPVNAYGGATGTITCRGTYDENLAFTTSGCPS